MRVLRFRVNPFVLLQKSFHLRWGYWLYKEAVPPRCQHIVVGQGPVVQKLCQCCSYVNRGEITHVRSLQRMHQIRVVVTLQLFEDIQYMLSGRRE